MSVTPTDWTRAEWLAYADRLLDGARRWASPSGARITPPGAEGGYGRDVDGLEGFARTLLLAGFRITGARGQGVDDLIAFVLRGITAGVDPDNPERWLRPDEHGQAKVEAASIALILDMTRPWVWASLDETTQQRVIGYLTPVVGDDAYPKTNWLWFRIVVETFLRSVGGPWSASDIAADLALHDSLVRQDGWISDGSERSFDHYVGWALHLYPVLWSRMHGADQLAPGRTAHDVERLDRYLLDATALVGADGSPLIQGRSLIYRFAAAAPFWAGVIAEVPSTSPGMLRHAANRIVGHFAARGVPDDDDLLTLGWHGPWRRLAQGYSGTGSPYWASKGLLGIALPADHPVWTAPAEPLPVETGDVRRTIAAPGWVVAGTKSDGIVRVVNHGTDHAGEGDLVGDSPLYARIGYSTATAPLHDRRAWREPLEQSVALVDAAGRATHRAGMTLHGVRRVADAAIAASTATTHWIDPDEQQVHHGSGITGRVTVAGRLTVCSIMRGAWEARLVRVDELASTVAAGDVRLRIGGWPVAPDPHDSVADGAAASVRAGDLISAVTGSGGTARVVERPGASPLGDAAVPVLEHPVVPGTWVTALVTLSGVEVGTRAAIRVDGDSVAVTWPDGAITVIDDVDSRPAVGADR